MPRSSVDFLSHAWNCIFRCITTRNQWICFSTGHGASSTAALWTFLRFLNLQITSELWVIPSKSTDLCLLCSICRFNFFFSFSISFSMWQLASNFSHSLILLITCFLLIAWGISSPSSRTKPLATACASLINTNKVSKRFWSKIEAWVSRHRLWNRRGLEQ